MKETWKDSMRRKLENFEAEAPEGLWDDIERQMAQTEAATGNGDKRRKLVAVWRWSAAAACVAGIAGYFLFAPEWNENETSLASSKTASCDIRHEYTPSGNRSAKATAERAAVKPVEKTLAMATAKKATAGTVLATNNDRVSSAETDEASADKEESAAENSGKKEEKEQSVVVTGGSSSANGQTRPQGTFRPTVSSNRKTADNRISLGLYAMNGGGSSSTGGGMPMVSESVQLLGDTPFDGEGESMVRQMYEAQTGEKTKHRMPIRSGLSVRYGVTERLGVETGLCYTYLSSDFTYGPAGNGESTDQTLHFVGVPLNVSYTLWGNKLFNVYVSGGGMAEFNVKGKAVTTTTIGGQVADEAEDDVRTKRVQWSVNAAAGAQLNLFSGVGVYVEPGVAYYIANGTSVKSAYTDRPWNFNLKIGLRYSFK